MSHDCDKIPYLEKLEENYDRLQKDIDKLDDNYTDLTGAINKLTGGIEANRHWHIITTTISAITCTIIFGILQVCITMI